MDPLSHGPSDPLPPLGPPFAQFRFPTVPLKLDPQRIQSVLTSEAPPCNRFFTNFLGVSRFRQLDSRH